VAYYLDHALRELTPRRVGGAARALHNQ
jgi:hypothetical protein